MKIQDTSDELLEEPAVEAVEYDEDTNAVTAFVQSGTSPTDDVERRLQDVVSNAELVVSEIGSDEELQSDDDDLIEVAYDPVDRHRPVVAGMCEANVHHPQGTGGPLARVTDSSKGIWDGDVTTGELVRLSNNHVYARANEAQLGDSIIQPSTLFSDDSDHDEVGRLRGYVPVSGSGTRVDVAARSARLAEDGDSTGYYSLGEQRPTGVCTDYETLVGESVTKVGQMTEVTEGTVLSSSVSTRLRAGGRIYRVDDQLLVSMGFALDGDSGSAVLNTETGNLVGLVAGMRSNGCIFVNKMTNIQEDFGVTPVVGE